MESQHLINVHIVVISGDDDLIEPPIFKQGPGEPLHQNGHLKWNSKVILTLQKYIIIFKLKNVIHVIIFVRRYKENFGSHEIK